ncbi:MAG: radical SAM protein [Candidatus Peribacteraceae bacterium]|nr:radical SAM protein [Candidatus Peribacteraceae bacterium]
MKVALAFPAPTPPFRNLEGGYGDSEKTLLPPPTGLSVIACALQETRDDIETTVIPPQIIEPSGAVRYRKIEEVTQDCKDADCVGISCRWDNQEAALLLADAVRQTNEKSRIVFGGPNMWSSTMAEMVLRNVPSVDIVVRQAGERALGEYLEGTSLFAIPNLTYRQQGIPHSNYAGAPDMNKLPLWDFRHVRDPRHLAPFDARNPAFHAPRDLDLTPSVESNRGCIKASHEGACPYCSSGRDSFKTLDAPRFFEELAHLYAQHGMKDFFVADNIFSVSPRRVEELRKMRVERRRDLPEDLRMRAYAYPTDFRGENGWRTAEHLQVMGVRELFIGQETFDAEIARSLKKEIPKVEEMVQTLVMLKRFGFAVKIALLLGLPGETKESLQKNVDGLQRLLDACSTPDPAEGGLKSVDISRVMPLVGTELYDLLLKNPQACKTYLDIVLKPLHEDVCPRYPLLFRLLLEHHTSVTVDDVTAAEKKMISAARKALDPTKVGGFGV